MVSDFSEAKRARGQESFLLQSVEGTALLFHLRLGLGLRTEVWTERKQARDRVHMDF